MEDAFDGDMKPMLTLRNRINVMIRRVSSRFGPTRRRRLSYSTTACPPGQFLLLVAMRETNLERLNFSVITGCHPSCASKTNTMRCLIWDRRQRSRCPNCRLNSAAMTRHMNMRVSRLALMPGGAEEVESFENYCAQRFRNRRPFTESHRGSSGVPDSRR